jgi:hypothetical protein
MAGVLMTTVVASAAAQDSTAPQVPAWVHTEQAVQNFVAQPSGQVRNLKTTAAVANGFAATSSSVSPMQGNGMRWNGLVEGGFTSAGGGGFTVGGGAQASNLAGNELFGLLIDVLYANVGGCDACDLLGGDFSAHTISVGVAFEYKLKEMSSGWRPSVGGGLAWVRFSYSSDAFSGFCDLIGGCSATSAGIEGFFSLTKNALMLQGRFQSVGGGGLLGLVGYRFGAK